MRPKHTIAASSWKPLMSFDAGSPPYIAKLDDYETEAYHCGFILECGH